MFFFYSRCIILRRLMKKTHRVNIYNKTLLFAGKSKAASKGEPRSRDRDCPPPDAARGWEWVGESKTCTMQTKAN